MQPLEQWLDNDLSQSAQPLLSLMRQFTKTWRTIQTAQAVGDLATLSNNLSQLGTILEQIPQVLGGALRTATAYDVKEYLADLFDSEFKSACTESALTLEGQYPRYLVYPIQVEVNDRRMGVLINRKFHTAYVSLTSSRPSAVSATAY